MKANKQARIRDNRTEDHQDEPEARQPAVELDPAEQSYTAFIAGFSEAKGCRVKVHRQTPRGRQYCFTGTPEEIDSEETIRLFHAKQPYAHEDGLYYLSVEVNGELRSCFPVNIAPQVGAPEQQQQASGGMAEMLRMIQAQNERLERFLMDGRQREQPPMLEMVEGLQRLDQMRGGSQQQLPIDTLMKAIELGQKMNGAGVPVDSWEGMLRDVIKENAPALVPVLLSAFRGNQQQIPEPVPPGAPERKEAAVTPEQQQQQVERVMQDSLKAAIVFLKNKAKRNSDPGLYVDMIVDNREDPLYARLISDILDKDFSAFAAIDPEIEKPEYDAFFRFIYNGIRSVFDQSRAVADDSKGKAGNKGDAANNGAAVKKGSK
jgi:hypothetical protein